MMKAEQKIGKSYKGKHKSVKKIKRRTLAAKKGKLNKNPNGKRLILTPGQTGGAIPLIPIFAELSALGSLMSGGASVYNAIQNSKMKKGKKLMNTLPNRPLTSRDIIKYVAKFNISHFRGVFSRDNLPKKPLAIECGILNLDVSSGDGSHWVAFYKIKDKVFNWKFDCIDCKLFSISKLYEDSEIALLSLQTFNSFPNIIDAFNNRLKIEVIPSKRNKYKSHIFAFCLEEGCYEIEDINNKIAKELSQVNNKYGTQLTFSVRIDPVDFRTYIKCNGILQFNTQYSIAPVLGYDVDHFMKLVDRKKTANLNTINSIKVLCNIAHGSFNNQLQSHSIYEFFPSGRTGTKVVQSPSNLIYNRLNKTDINLITIQLVEQNNKPIDNFNETLTVVLHIKRHGSHY
ncbi:hypothetical protein AGLY_018351 [Aphis glycines]|uniref:Uncharacterized protein n=1 Tax=Aphis glycines TaxID=307491 RepID=A0A6G0SSH0_APHGL|nr:hypothetical protein AGLY_018351 [Aphis glycines]